jgi:hypothetical protein
MANYADFYSIIANKAPDENGEDASNHDLSFFIVPSGIPGIKIVEDWDTLGMRGTQSHQVIFDDVYIPEENVFLGITGFALIKITRALKVLEGVIAQLSKDSVNLFLITLDCALARSSRASARETLGYVPKASNLRFPLRRQAMCQYFLLSGFTKR